MDGVCEENGAHILTDLYDDEEDVYGESHTSGPVGQPYNGPVEALILLFHDQAEEIMVREFIFTSQGSFKRLQDEFIESLVMWRRRWGKHLFPRVVCTFCKSSVT